MLSEFKDTWDNQDGQISAVKHLIQLSLQEDRPNISAACHFDHDQEGSKMKKRQNGLKVMKISQTKCAALIVFALKMVDGWVSGSGIKQ